MVRILKESTPFGCTDKRMFDGKSEMEIKDILMKAAPNSTVTTSAPMASHSTRFRKEEAGNWSFRPDRGYAYTDTRGSLSLANIILRNGVDSVNLLGCD